MNFNLYSVQEMDYKKVLVIKDYHNIIDQESRQAYSAKHRKLLSELWNKKNIYLKEYIKQIQWNLYSADTLRTKASVPWIEVPPD